MSVAFEEPRVFQPNDPFRQHPFVVERFVGAGASGQVYALRHRYTGDRFALKVAHLKDWRSARKVARSLIEGQATYALRHPNVVVVHDIGWEHDGMVWQRMELLEGAAVGDLLGRHGAFSPLYAIEVALEIAAGLQAAHERQIIHRDIHPFNVFLCAEGRVKVLDFSMAKVIASGLQTTRGSRAMGTEGYMAPEYLKGRVVTPQLDVYALGMLFWEMLVGRHPFRVAGVDMLTLVKRCLEEDPPSLVGAAGLPGYCDEVIRGATARDPARRFVGMWGLIQALQGLREKLLGDPAAAVVVMRKRWERQHPIGEPAEGYALQAEMEGVPAGITVPPVTDRRVVVAGERPGGEESRRVVAKTVPMGVVASGGELGGGGGVERRSAPTVMMSVAMVPAGVTGSGVDVGAPTVRGGARPRKWVVWVVVVAVILILLAVTLWVLVGTPVLSAAPPASSSSSAVRTAVSAAPSPPARLRAPSSKP